MSKCNQTRSLPCSTAFPHSANSGIRFENLNLTRDTYIQEDRPRCAVFLVRLRSEILVCNVIFSTSTPVSSISSSNSQNKSVYGSRATIPLHDVPVEHAVLRHRKKKQRERDVPTVAGSPNDIMIYMEEAFTSQLQSASASLCVLP